VRGQYQPELKWYALMTHFGRERKIQERILNEFGARIDEVLIPELSGGQSPETPRNKRELLVSNHLFLRCRMNDEIYMTISAYPGVFSILGRAYRIPSVIADEEIRAFKSLLGADPRPHMASRLNIGAPVRIIHGLMKGLQGRIVEVHSRLIKIETNFSFLGNESVVVVAVPREHVWIDEQRADSGSPAMNQPLLVH
jgi:transcription antitermination factor NusG